MVELAYRIAKKAHAGQKDKGGNEYINHPIKVASMLESEEEKAVALLHDVVEDTDVTLEMLSESFPSDIVVNSVLNLSKNGV